MADEFVPIDALAMDGQERFLRFPDRDHWGWYDKARKAWCYRPTINPGYQVHEAAPSAYKRREWDFIWLPLERRER